VVLINLGKLNCGGGVVLINLSKLNCGGGGGFN